MKSSYSLSGPPTPLRPLATSWRPATAGKGDSANAAATAASGDAALDNNARTSSSCCCSTPLGATPTALSVPPIPPTHISDLGDDLLREILGKTGVLDRAVTARMVSRSWRNALAPPPEANAAVTGRGLCKDVDATTEPRLLCRVSGWKEGGTRANLCVFCPGIEQTQGQIHLFSPSLFFFLFFHFAFNLHQRQQQKTITYQFDTDLLLRLLWLSSWGGNPRAADVPSWGSTFPWLRSLKFAGARWRPTAAHRVPNLRRVLRACPGLKRVDATALQVLVPVGGGGAAEGDDLFFDAAEAQLLASAALHHGRVEELELDVAVRLSLDDAAEPPLLSPGEEEEEDGGAEQRRRRGVWESEEATPMETEQRREHRAAAAPSFSSPPSPPLLRLLPTSAIASDPSAAHTAAVDVAEVVLAGKTPLRVRRLSLSTPPTATAAAAALVPPASVSSSSFLPLAGERAVLASRCFRLGRAAALGGELRTLTLDRLTPEEAAAAVIGALSLSSPPSPSFAEAAKKGKLERIEFRGVGGGAACCWSESVAAAVAGALSNSGSFPATLREIVFEGDAGGRDEGERRRVEASVRRAVPASGIGGSCRRVSVRFVEESAARRASGAAYAARAAAASAVAARAAANAPGAPAVAALRAAVPAV